MNLGSVVHILEIVIGLGILVFVHELGHFIAAKWSGVRVDKFALGMGPKIFGVTVGETEYSIRCLPVGGFVMMAGEEPGSTTEAPPERQYRNAKPGRKAAIAFAGSFMNMVTAVVLFAVALGVGVDFIRPVVGYVKPDSPADKAGLRLGDEIVAIRGDRDIDWADVRSEIAVTGKGDNITFTVKRGDGEFDLSIPPRQAEKGEIPAVGILAAAGRIVRGIDNDSASAEAGLKVGDEIRTVDGRQYINWLDAQHYLAARVGRPVAFEVIRDGEPVAVSVTPRPGKIGDVGLAPEGFPSVTKVLEGSPAQAAGVKAGDQITAVAGRETRLARDVSIMAIANMGKPTTLRLKHEDGAESEVVVTFEVRPYEDSPRLGMEIESPKPVVGAVAPGSAADKAGFRPGDELTMIGKVSLEKESWDAVWVLLNRAVEKKQKEIAIARRAGQAEFEAVKLPVSVVDSPMDADIGVITDNGVKRYQYDFWRAPWVGIKKSYRVVRLIVGSIRGIFQGSIPFKGLAGPVGIFDLGVEVAASGVMTFVYWMAFLSANFAVVNLLPMPPFDGGLLVFTAIEKIRRKPLSEKVQMVAMTIGWALVLVLLVFITINDIKRIAGIGN